MDDVPPEGTVNRLRWLEAQAEQAYSDMYEAQAGSELAARYSDAKEFLHDAIGLAHRLGLAGEAERLSQRLTEIKTVFRGQFSF
ncbi:MAG: hypothetical protein MUO37_08280 [Methyloceanibacter sp.]|jgi:hypothetical protein|nr:hypothetical protein [Methyloceanibacter sp.]